MAFAVAGLFADGETVVQDVAMRARSYPEFEKALERIHESETRSHHHAGDQFARRPSRTLMRNESRSGHRVIAIDGPAASGKSSVARALAQRLGFVYVNSGAMYRAITWHVLDRGIDPTTPAAIAAARRKCAHRLSICEDNDSRILIDGIDPARCICAMRA